MSKQSPRVRATAALRRSSKSVTTKLQPRVDSLEPHRSTATATTARTFAVGDLVASRSPRAAR